MAKCFGRFLDWRRLFLSERQEEENIQWLVFGAAWGTPPLWKDGIITSETENSDNEDRSGRHQDTVF